jgi:hypothetical protein
MRNPGFGFGAPLTKGNTDYHPWLWYRGDAMVLSAGKVATATDLSGNGRNGTGQGGALPPWEATGFAGKPCMHGDAASWLNLPDMSALTAGHIFVAVQADADPPAGSTDAEIWLLGTGATTFFPFTDGVVYDSAGTDTRKTTVNPTPSLALPHIYEVISVAGEWTSKLDGAQLFTTATNAVAFQAAPRLGGIAVSTWKGRIAEFIVFPGKLDTTHANAFRQDIGARYGITVS